MTAAGRWERTKSLFHAALEKPAGERNEFLTGACGGDEHLLREVNELVAADGEGGWLDDAADGVATSSRTGETVQGRRIGPYRIVRELGRGGMGTVYLAERDDQEFTRRVALKVIKRGMDTAFILKRFRNERQILAQLDHPNVARLLDGGTTEDDGLPFFVMEYIDGVPIGRWVRERNLSVPGRLQLFLDVCAGVSHAHQNLVIHRDIKPGNILVTEHGIPKLLDFGIAKILAPEGEESTATALPLFTPEYASPEQLRGGPLGTPSDVYLLGVLLFELLAGRRPSPATAHREAEPLRAADPKLPKDLDTIVAMALRFDPARRYPSVERFSEDVRQQLAGRPVSARNVTLGYRTATFVRRNRTAVAAGSLLAITLLTGLVVTVWQARVAVAERARAERRLGQLRQLTGRVLFDYHDAIEPLPGATAVRERLVRDALSYLDDLSKDADENPELLRELAAAHLKVGDVQGRPDTPNLGDSEGAAKSYGSALSLLDGLLERSPGQRDLRDQRALALERLSGLDARALRSGAAVRRARRAFSERYELLETRPEALFERRRMGDVWFTLGTALWATPAVLTDPGISGETLSAFEASLALREDIASGSSAPEDRWALVKSEEQVGHVLLSLGRSPEEALFHVDRARRVLSGLFGTTPRDARERRGLAGVTLVRGDALLVLSGPRAALRAYQQSLETFEDLLTVDPSNLEARRDVSRVATRIGLARDPRLRITGAGPGASRSE